MLLEILDRLRNLSREQATVEFKKNWDDPKDIGEYISALGNAAVLEKCDRAWMVWGIDNQTHAVCGTCFTPHSSRGEGNCVAHQDYRLGGKINVTEHPEKLVFSNLGQFIPPSVEWMLEHQSPPEHYRNQWLIDGMIRLRMIDQVGSGIRRMFETQRERFFPLPNYKFETTELGHPRVEVAISGQILDIKYTHMLMKRSDLDLRSVLLLDRVQRKEKLSLEQAQELKRMKLIEGRAPNYFVSSKVADWADEKAKYIRTRGLDDGYYRELVVKYLRTYGQVTRKEIDECLEKKLPDVLNAAQKAHKVRNLLQAMRRDGLIQRVGAKATAKWELVRCLS